MRVTRTDHPIPRVKCVVNTCQYWNQGNYCQAEAIEIQPQNARSLEETDCATYAGEREGK